MSDRLAAIKARLAAATQLVGCATCMGDNVGSCFACKGAGRVEVLTNNFEEHAPADVAWLLGEVERLRLALDNRNLHDGTPLGRELVTLRAQLARAVDALEHLVYWQDKEGHIDESWRQHARDFLRTTEGGTDGE